MNEELAAVIAQAASAALLRIGNTYREQGLFHHALYPYLKILACYPDSEEAPEAVDQVVDIAAVFEKKMQFHIAMSVYDRLERALRFRRWGGHMLTSEGYVL